MPDKKADGFFHLTGVPHQDESNELLIETSETEINAVNQEITHFESLVPTKEVTRFSKTNFISRLPSLIKHLDDSGQHEKSLELIISILADTGLIFPIGPNYLEYKTYIQNHQFQINTRKALKSCITTGSPTTLSARDQDLLAIANEIEPPSLIYDPKLLTDYQTRQSELRKIFSLFANRHDTTFYSPAPKSLNRAMLDAALDDLIAKIEQTSSTGAFAVSVQNFVSVFATYKKYSVRTLNEKSTLVSRLQLLLHAADQLYPTASSFKLIVLWCFLITNDSYISGRRAVPVSCEAPKALNERDCILFLDLCMTFGAPTSTWKYFSKLYPTIPSKKAQSDTYAFLIECFNKKSSAFRKKIQSSINGCLFLDPYQITFAFKSKVYKTHEDELTPYRVKLAEVLSRNTHMRKKYQAYWESATASFKDLESILKELHAISAVNTYFASSENDLLNICKQSPTLGIPANLEVKQLEDNLLEAALQSLILEEAKQSLMQIILSAVGISSCESELKK